MYIDDNMPTDELLLRVYTTMRQLHGQMDELSSIQWEQAPSNGPTTPGPKSKGGLPNDPTASAALDPRRLAARKAFDDTRTKLNIALTALASAKFAAEKAISYYYQDDVSSKEIK